MPFTKGSRPSPLVSIDVKTIHARLAKLGVGETVTYDELSKLIGREVRTGGSAAWVLSRARHKCLYEDGIVISSVMKVGVKRLSDAEIVDTGQDIVSRIHNMTVTGMRRLSAIKSYDALTGDRKVKFNAYTSICGTLGHFTKSKQVEAVSKAAEKSGGQLPLQRMLEAFQEK